MSEVDEDAAVLEELEAAEADEDDSEELYACAE